jgi:hypothetical protein
VISRSARAALVLGVALACSSAGAADKAGATDAKLRWELERSMCMSGSSNQDRATCLREAGAAFEEAKRGGLADGAAPYAQNARQRCDRLPAEERRACVARMQGQGTTRGSAATGGIYRELIFYDVVAPETAVPATLPPSGEGAMATPVK